MGNSIVLGFMVLSSIGCLDASTAREDIFATSYARNFSARQATELLSLANSNGINVIYTEESLGKMQSAVRNLACAFMLSKLREKGVELPEFVSSDSPSRASRSLTPQSTQRVADVNGIDNHQQQQDASDASSSGGPMYWVCDKLSKVCNAAFAARDMAMDYVRQHPGLVVAGTAAVGFAVGRLSTRQ